MSLTICAVLIANIALIVNIIRTTGKDIKVSKSGVTQIDRIRNIMSDSDIEATPHLSNATLSPSNGVLHPGSLDEAVTWRLLRTRQRLIVNNYSYKYKLDSRRACEKKAVVMVICFSTPAENVDERAKFRARMKEFKVWSNALHTVHIFFLGLPREGVAKDVQLKISHESLEHDDIVQGDFIDSPQNASLKTMFILKWVAMKCSGARFVVKASLKCDLNVPMLRAELTKARSSSHLFMMGRLATKDVLKTMEMKLESAIPYSVYKLDEYPEFLNGDAVGFPMEVAAITFQFALRLPLFRLENVFFTGIIATLLNIPLIDNPAMYFNNCTDIPKDQLLGPLSF
ncbi:beta-1,3-galactosyltransferase 1 [Biomphalaria glabrata]|nr:beta-1,3-galactosyltransferase 1 [Biomphalaria glabrata]